MKWIKYIFSSLWRLWFFLMFLIVFIVFIPGLFVFTAIIKNQIIVAHLTRYWSKITLWLSFIFPIVDWEEKINKDRPHIFCANHVSALDIPLILAIIPVPLQYIGKAEIAQIPIFGYFFKKNAVIVNRKSRKNSYEAFIQAGKKLTQGMNMCIFPEGGIPPSHIFLKKFKNGPFKLAKEQNVELVPITLADNKNIFPQEYFKGRPGIVRLTVHRSISPKQFKEKTIENLNNSVYNTIFEKLNFYGK